MSGKVIGNIIKIFEASFRCGPWKTQSGWPKFKYKFINMI